MAAVVKALEEEGEKPPERREKSPTEDCHKPRLGPKPHEAFQGLGMQQRGQVEPRDTQQYPLG